MNGWKHGHLTAVAALVASTGLAIAWAAGLVVDPGAWPVRAGLAALGVALTAATATLWLRHAARYRRAVERHFEALCAIDPRDLCTDLADDLTLPARSAWRGVADRVRERFVEHGRRIAELEHVQTAASIRCRRATDEADRIKAVFSSLAEPILAIDDYDELLLANAPAEELFEFKVGDAENRALAQLVRCQELVKLLTTTCHHKTPGARTDEIAIPDKDGTPRWYRVTAARLPAADDRTAAPGTLGHGAVAVLRDVGEHKVLQKRHAEFVSAVSHEMKTPLAGIKAYVEMLVDGDAEDEQTREEFLDVINGQADRLQRLIDNMLNLARIEAGVVNVNKQPQSLNELLEEAFRVVQPAAEAKRIELSSDLSPMYLGVLADRDMLLQAAINLLSNAVKYTHEGGRVVLRSRLDNDQLRFEVQDSGVGLSEEDCRRVFEKFYRVGKDKNMASGTGLGLPLARHIVEDVHGGRLWVESVPGEGSTFAVTIPGTGQLT